MTTTYSKEINIYNTEAIQESINEAGTTASNYITEVSADNGIVVATEGHGTTDGAITASTTGWHIGDVLEFLRQGISRFWIGLKNQGDTTPTVRIGKAYNSQASDNESHMELDYHSLQLIDKNGSTYLHVSDFRKANGIAEIDDRFIGDGHTDQFELSTPISRVLDPEFSLTVDGSQPGFNYEIFYDATTSLATIHNTSTGSAYVPSIGAVIVISYKTDSELAKAYTFGTREGNVGAFSIAEGLNTTASGMYSHAEGANTVARGYISHAEGDGAEAGGAYSHAEGDGTTAYGMCSHAEGCDTNARSNYSHAEGNDTETWGEYSHAEGNGTSTSAGCAHAQGYQTEANGYCSHAEGWKTKANGYYSHSEGWETIAKGSCSHVIGKYNIQDSNSTYAAIIGNGTADNARSNALAVDWSGNVLIDGDVKNMSGTKLYADASHTHSYLPLAGGTMTGSLTINGANATIKNGGFYKQSTDASYDRDGAVPSSEIWVNMLTNNDKDGNAFASLTTARRTSSGGGWNDVGLYVYSHDGTSQIQHSLILGIKSDGSKRVYIDREPWIEALGIGGESSLTFSSNVSIPNSTYAVLKVTSGGTTYDHLSLAAGTWVITGGILYASKANGQRYICITTASGSTAPSSTEALDCAEYVDCNSTATQVRLSTTRIVKITSTTNYYLKAWQSSGSALDAQGKLHAVRIA